MACPLCMLDYGWVCRQQLRSKNISTFVAWYACTEWLFFLFAQLQVCRRQLGSKDEALRILKGELDSSQYHNQTLEQELVQLVRPVPASAYLRGT